MRKFHDRRAYSPRRALSPHFMLHEFTKSATAAKHQLNNTPREEFELANLRALAANILEPARAIIGAPIIITSGYRCATLNRLIGGAARSQHMLGEAADFIVQGFDMEAVALLLSTSRALPYDQLVYEVREREDAAPMCWVHISHKRMGRNRREVLSIRRSAGDKKQVLPGIQGTAEFSQLTASAAGGLFLKCPK